MFGSPTKRHDASTLTTVFQVGGSLGGLIHGVVFKRLGHNVRIIERNPSPLLHDQGAGVVAQPQVQEFLRDYDLTHREYAVTSPKLQFLNMEGDVVQTIDMVWKLTSWDLLYYLLRANFDGVKSAYCDVPEPAEGDGTGIYDYGHTATNVRYEDGQVWVDFKNRDGKEESAAPDMVIASDGPSSTIRSLLTPTVERKYVGYVAWRGTIPEAEAPPRSVEAFGKNFSLFQGDATHILM